MNSKELLEKYPKVSEVIVKHYSDIFVKSIESADIPEEYKELYQNQQIDEEYVAKFIDSNPSGTFDVFDKHELYIGITPVYNIGGVGFQYTITTLMSGEADTRKDAEIKAVELAFQLLNNKL